MFGLRQFLPVLVDADGKKLPVNREGKSINAHDPANWMSYQEAVACGFTGVGFVLTESDPYFCLDIDDALTPSGWSADALEAVNLFPGARVEVSFSGSGLHIWGRYTNMPPHRCKNTRLGFELYHKERFILIGSGENGDHEVDCTAQLPVAIEKWFNPTDTSGGLDGWTSEPVAEWCGPTDDEELIKRALATKSAASKMGYKVSFADLWEANVDALANAFPSTDDRPYDGSQADAALAQRLAFWTGRNCERALTIMQQSALRREKWEREDYLPRTIQAACDRQVEVYQRKADNPNRKTDAPAEAVPSGSSVAGGWVRTDELPELFKGCVYLADQHKALIPGGFILKPEQFAVMFGGRKFMLDETKSSRNAWEAFTQSIHWRPNVAHGLAFRPELEPGALIEEEGRTLANSWWPSDTLSVPGDVSPILGLLGKILPDDRDRAIFLNYLAALVQYPGVKFQWAPVLQGVKGNGKSAFISCISRAVGLRYTHLPDAADIGNKFNAWLDRRLFIGVEEVYASEKRELLEALKPMITNSRMGMQDKGGSQYTGDNRANFILCTNHRDGIPVTTDERRYAIFYTAQQTVEDLVRDGMTGSYFPDLYAWLRNGGFSHFTHYLQNFPIADELNPATRCHRAPRTSTTDDALAASLGRVEQEIMEAIESGQPGFCGGWVSSIMLDRLLEQRRLSSRVAPNKRRALMQALGYDYHAALVGGRVNSNVTPDGGKPRLYVKIGTPAAALNSPADVVKHYSDAQCLTPAGIGSATVLAYAKPH